MRLRYRFLAAWGALAAALIAVVGIVAAVFVASLEPDQRSALLALAHGREGLLALAPIGLLAAAWGAAALAFHGYVRPAIRIEEAIRVARGANPGHRAALSGGAEMRRLAAAANAFADDMQALRAEMTARIERANARLRQETNRLAALMADLSQSVVVCNAEGRILLYNAQARELLEAWGEGGAFLGLGRSIHAFVERGLIDHALDSIRARSAGPAASTHFVIAHGGRLVRACLSPLAGEGAGFTGFVLVMEDVTRAVEANSRRDSLLQSLAENTRASLGAIRAAIETMLDFPDMEGGERQRFSEAIRAEAEKLSAWLSGRLDEEADALRSQWPLEDMLAADLLALLARRLEADLAVSVAADPGGAPLWLRVDSFSLAGVLVSILRRVRRERRVERVELRLRGEARYARLEMRWPGAGAVPEWLADWEGSAAAEAAGAAMRDLVERHGGEAWCTADRAAQAHCLCVQLPLALEAARGAAPRLAERPEFYDFDLFHQPGQTPDLDERRLTDLAYTVFDTETTGLNPTGGDEIISIGAVRVVNGRLLRNETYQQLIDPRRPLAAESMAVHGITPAMLEGKPPIEAVLPTFHAFAEETVLVGHNAAFDMRFLQLKEAASGVRFTQPVLDTLLLSAVAHPGLEAGEHGLEALAARLGVEVAGRHTALGDAIVTAEVFLRLLPLLAERGIHTLRQAREASQKTLYAKLGY